MGWIVVYPGTVYHAMGSTEGQGYICPHHPSHPPVVHPSPASHGPPLASHGPPVNVHFYGKTVDFGMSWIGVISGIMGHSVRNGVSHRVINEG